VLIFVPMGLDLYEVLLSVLRIGAVAVFLDPSAGDDHVAQCCARIPPKGYLARRRPRCCVGGCPPCERSRGAS